MKEENLVKELSKRFNKKEKTIKYMIQILEKEKYNLKEIEELIIEFMGR